MLVFKNYMTNFAANIIYKTKNKTKMKKILLSLMALASVSAFAFNPVLSRSNAVPTTKQSATFKAAAEAEEFVYGVQPTGDAYGLGVQTKSVLFYNFVKLPASMSTMLAGRQILAVNFALGNCDAKAPQTAIVGNTSLDEGLTKHQILNQAFTGSFAATNQDLAVWNHVELAEPITIEAGQDYYIGYTVQSGSTTDYPVGAVEGTATPGVNDVAYMVYQGQEYILSFEGSGVIQSIGLTISGAAPSFSDLTLSSITFPSLLAAGTDANVKFSVSNGGTEPVSQFDLEYGFNGGTPAKVTYQEALQPGDLKNFTLTIPTTAELAGENTVQVEITNLNGDGTVDVFPETNVGSGSIAVYDPDNKVERNYLLIENFTGQLCGNCPSAHTLMENAIKALTKDLGSDRTAVVAHHAGYLDDDFTTDADKGYTYFYNAGGSTYAPAMMLDRTYYDDLAGTNTVVFNPLSYSTTTKMKKAFKKMLDRPTFVRLNATSTYNEATEELTFELDAEKVAHLRTGVADEFFVVANVFITESGLVASQSGGGSSYTHNHVFRADLGEVWGYPVNWDANNRYHDTFSISLAGTGWNKDKLEAVAFISYLDLRNPLNCDVLNTEKIDVSAIISGVNPVLVEKGIKVYSSGNAIVIEGNYRNAKVYGTDGRLVRNAMSETFITVPSGIYVVTVDGEATKVFVK